LPALHRFVAQGFSLALGLVARSFDGCARILRWIAGCGYALNEWKLQRIGSTVSFVAMMAAT
jgi:hypothetical protein